MEREGRGKRRGAEREGTKGERGKRERETSPLIEISGYATARVVFNQLLCTCEHRIQVRSDVIRRTIS